MKDTKPKGPVGYRKSVGMLLELLAALGLFSSTAAAQQYLFGRADFATGNTPLSVVTADFNGDGKLDLAVVNRGDNTVSILLGKPDGTFQTHVDYATGSAPASVAVGDFNGDGKLDLAVANSFDSTVSILLGNGDGTFRAHVDYAAGVEPVSVTTGDFNGDGKLDLAVANQNCLSGPPCGVGSVSILLGKGDGTFPTHIEYATGSVPSSVTTGDFNGDGKLDLAIANSSDNTVSILLGNGDGSFQAHVDYAVGVKPVSVATADFNRDGKLDVAVANVNCTSPNPPPPGCGPGSVSILLGKGDGTFQANVDYTASPSPSWVTVGDFNGDGKLDLAVAAPNCLYGTPCGVGPVSILLGNGDGTFQAPVDYFTGGVPDSVTVGDFNGDGNLDLAAANQSDNKVSVLLGKGDGTFQSPANYVGFFGFQASVTTGDFNGDGTLDLAVTDTDFGTQFVAILLGNGDGTFKGSFGYATGSFPNSVTTGDFNGDGKLDLATANGFCPIFPCVAGSVSILLGNGDGTFQPHVDYAAGRGASVTAGDFNGDGKLDLAVANPLDDSISILLGNGDGTFQRTVYYSTDFSSGPLSVTTGDFNKDGKLDLAVANSVGATVSILLGRGDGTFRPHVDYATNASSGSLFGPSSVATGDLNGDGKLDLAVANDDTGTVSVLLGNGDGTFQTHVDYALALGAGPKGVAIGDLNGDGKLDLVVVDGSGFVSILLGNGDGTFQDHVDRPTPQFPPQYSTSVIMADFSKPGRGRRAC